MATTHKLADEFILVAGSISKNTEDVVIDTAHDFVKAFVAEVLESGGGLVVYTAGQVCNDRNKPLLFDWTVAEAVNALLPDQSSNIRLKIVASQQRLRDKATSEQRKLLNGMIARGVAECIPLDDDVVTGGNVGEEQVEVATAMIAIGGGKGVRDRANKMAKRKLPVIPLDLELGALSEDGPGATQILSAFQSTPLKYMPMTGDSVVRLLPALSLEDPALEFPDISKKLIDILFEEQQAKLAAQPPDVLVLTAIDVELRAAKQAFGIPEDTAPITTKTGIHVWKAPVTRANGTIANCMVSSFSGPGNVDSAAVTSTLLVELEPAHVMMFGIAAGHRDKCALGEVQIVERVVAYEGAALLANGGVEHRPETYRLTMKVRQDLNSYMSNAVALEQRLTVKYGAMCIVFPNDGESGRVTTGVKPKTVTIASGEKLLRDGTAFSDLRKLHGKIEGAEMEAAGLMAACSYQKKPVLMIRGISDFGDSTKDNRFHHLAAQAAAAVTVDYIANGMTTHT